MIILSSVHTYLLHSSALYFVVSLIVYQEFLLGHFTLFYFDALLFCIVLFLISVYFVISFLMNLIDM